MTPSGHSRTALRDLFLTAVVEPMVAGATGERGPIQNLRGQVCVGEDELDSTQSGRPYLRLQRGTGWAEDEDELVWAVISTPRESLAYAMGTSDLDLELLDEQIDDLADYIEEWLSESDVAWGQLCRVPRPALPASTTWM